MQNETLTFEDGMRLTEYKCVKEYEDDTDEAFEELCCPEAGKPEMRRDVLSAIPHSRRPRSPAMSMDTCPAPLS